MGIWNRTKEIKLNLEIDVKPGFYMWYDENVNDEMKNKLDDFVNWVYNNYNVSTPVYINCINENFVKCDDDDDVEQGYVFQWANFDDYPNLHNDETCPVIELPVKEEIWSFEDILFSLMEAISCYFAWCLNEIDTFTIDEEEINTILDKYLEA